MKQFVYIIIFLLVLAVAVGVIYYFSQELDEHYQALERSDRVFYRNSQELEQNVEKKAIFDKAQLVVKENSVQGLEFDLKLIRRTRDLAMLEVSFTTQESLNDFAWLVLQKQNGQWQLLILETNQSVIKKQVPELFY